ncbi:purine-nucleoside phosphorylase [Paenibacillus aquistagni]|uniref:purine-nucleoside phosphorylase n=1 Tax=Paenibacillus aquistagni TaxID=1852522 RepID=UPI00145BA77A|nr:purine-nucleoside phosphorylase [Paenibacillus aquistagni]NMM53338.1 purine-nucleoside phosphorylase [Paenibacillus aquistagni]
MGLVINAAVEEVSDKVLLPGDPLRAQYIAENYLEDAACYCEVRGMLGFTGFYKGERISVQGTGMGIPSLSAYVYELITTYNAKKLIRVGTCGTIQDDISIRDVVLVMSASTDSNYNYHRFPGFDFAPTASFNLLKEAYDHSLNLGLKTKVGSVLTTDHLYTGHVDTNHKFAQYGVLAVEMETAGLYTLAAEHGVAALSILTVSDHIFKEEAASLMERQTSVDHMIQVALATIISPTENR